MSKDKIAKRFAPKDYYSRNVATYDFLKIAGWFMLACSALASVGFYAHYIIPESAGPMRYPIAGVISVAVSLMIGGLFLPVYRHYLHFEDTPRPYERVHFLALVLVPLIALNAVADFVGAPTWAERVHSTVEAPDNTEAQARIDKVDEKIRRILDKYAWCPVHQSKHIGCASTVRLADEAQIKESAARFGHTPVADKAMIKALRAEKQVYLGDMSTSTAIYQQEASKRAERVSVSKSQYKGVSVAITLLYLLISAWRIRFGVKVAKDMDGLDRTDKRTEAPKKPRINTPARRVVQQAVPAPIGFGRLNTDEMSEVDKAKGYLAKYQHVVRSLQDGVSVREAARMHEVSKSTVQNVSRCMKILSQTSK